MKINRQTQRAALLAILLLLASGAAYAQRRERLLDGWRPAHYEVALEFDDNLTNIVQARVEITVEMLRGGLTNLDFDFGALRVDAVTINRKAARFAQEKGRLNVTLPENSIPREQLKVAVSYRGKPTDGLILANDKDGRPAAVGDNWPDRVHHWIPCFDHPSAKATVRFIIKAASRYVATANGKLESKQDSGAQTTWTYYEKTPIPPYCMIVAVGAFALTLPEKPASTPLTYYTPQSEGAFAPQGFAAAAPALEMFSGLVGPYPYDKLALIVGATRFGGMENSGAIVFASTMFDERGGPDVSQRFGVRRGIVDVTAHEIAHQWFGDDVTEATWADLWLSEGFATYFAGLFIEKYEGQAAFQDYMKRAAQSVFSYEKQSQTPIHDTATQDLFQLLNPNNYQKGAWVLHMLRGQLGDEKFFQGIKLYYESRRHGTATTENLRAALEQVSGRDLHEFFQRWIYDTGHPRYAFSYRWTAAGKDSGALTIFLDQKQAGAPFLMPVPVTLTLAGGKTRQITLTPAGRQSVWSFPKMPQPLKVQFDADETLLKEVEAKP